RSILRLWKRPPPLRAMKPVHQRKHGENRYVDLPVDLLGTGRAVASLQNDGRATTNPAGYLGCACVDALSSQRSRSAGAHRCRSEHRVEFADEALGVGRDVAREAIDCERLDRNASL